MRKMIGPLITIALVASAFATWSAASQEIKELPAALPTAEAASSKFSELDLNQDGFLTQAEAESVTALIEKWGELDTDEDGMLSVQELSSSNLLAAVKDI